MLTNLKYKLKKLRDSCIFLHQGPCTDQLFTYSHTITHILTRATGESGCYESGSHSLKLHITHGLHFPSCTALTHSRPPLHQSHSCHHSLINSDCLTTPAPHSLTHIKAAHKHSPSAKSCFALATFLSVLPRICYLCV